LHQAKVLIQCKCPCKAIYTIRVQNDNRTRLVVYDRLSFWRIITTAGATIPVHQFMVKFEMWYLYMYLRPYSKSSLTLNEWDSIWASLECQCYFWIAGWWVVTLVRYDINPPAIQKQQWHSREAQIELPLIECECAFRIRAKIFTTVTSIWNQAL
jgi:hypothetical protein